MEELANIEIQDVQIKLNINLDRYTTIKLAETGCIAFCYSECGLISLIEKIKQLRIKYHLVGWGANQVLLRTSDTLFIKLEFPFDSEVLEANSNEFLLPASCSLNQLSSVAVKKGFKGWEVFTGVPASLGGAICMNAGTSLGEIGELIKSIRILKTDGTIYKYECNASSFSYRKNNFLKDGEVILSAVVMHMGIDLNIKNIILSYLDKRKKTQPLTTKNCGSVFKNLEKFAAGKVVDLVGLKGFGPDAVKVSQKHGNFIENTGSASAQEFEQLVQLLKIEIERLSGQKFELEVKIY